MHCKKLIIFWSATVWHLLCTLQDLDCSNFAIFVEPNGGTLELFVPLQNIFKTRYKQTILKVNTTWFYADMATRSDFIYQFKSI